MAALWPTHGRVMDGVSVNPGVWVARGTVAVPVPLKQPPCSALQDAEELSYPRDGLKVSAPIKEEPMAQALHLCPSGASTWPAAPLGARR